MTEANIVTVLKALSELQSRMDGEACRRIFKDDGHMWLAFRNNDHQLPLSKFSGDTFALLARHLYMCTERAIAPKPFAVEMVSRQVACDLDKLGEAELVEWFNDTFKIGDVISVRKDNGNVIQATVSAAASLLGGHSAVGWFNEISGCYSLRRVVTTVIP